MWSRTELSRPSMPLLASLVLGLLHVATSQLITDPVDFTEVFLPPPDKNLTANCICDLTLNVCDTNCCCDPACPASLKEQFEADGTCLPEGPPAQELTYCAPKDFFVKVNMPATSDFSTITKRRADVEFLSELLCIVSDRNPALGDFYPDPVPGDDVDAVPCPKAADEATAAPYTYGRELQVLYATDTVASGLKLPSPAFSEQCFDGRTASFLVNSPATAKTDTTACTRTFPVCNDPALASATYADFKIDPEGSSPVSTSASWPNATVVSIKKVDLATGGVTDLPITDLASYTPFEDGLETCNNVVIGVKFTVYYSLDPAPSANGAAEGSVTGVDVELTLADVRRAVGTVTQRFGLRHVHTDVDRSDVTSFSGNPGYLPGFPVLAGLKVSDNATGEVAVARIAGGLPLPAADGEGRCAPGSLTAATFGGNVSSACFVELNAGELEALCQGGDPFFVLRGAALANSATATYIDSLLTGDVVAGVWGNSDWRDIRQWVNMTAAVPDPPTWNGATRTCSGVVTGFSYQVRTGVAFAANNLQSKVLHVRPCFAVGTLRFPAAFPNSTDAKFYLDLGATFVPKGDQKKQARSRPVPPLLINLPKDIFYPFVAS